MKRIKQALHIFYLKWIKGVCRTGLCCTCPYRNDCYNNMEEEYIDFK